MSHYSVTIADSASGPPGGPEEQRPELADADRLAALRDALSHIKFTGPAESQLQFALMTVCIQSIWLLPVFLRVLNLPYLSPLEWTLLKLEQSSASASGPDYAYALFAMFGILLGPFVLPALFVYLIYTPLQNSYRQRLKSSSLAVDFVHGRLNVNTVVESIHPALRRFHFVKPASLVLGELNLLLNEADWFLEPRRPFWRLAWLLRPAGLLFWCGAVLLFLTAGSVLLWPRLETSAIQQVDPGTMIIVLTLPITLAAAMSILVYPSYLWRDLRYRAWQRPLLEAIRAEVDRLLPPTPGRSSPSIGYEVRTLSSIFGLTKPQHTGEPPPAPPPPVDSESRLSRQLALGPVSTAGGNAVVPWVLWAVPAGLFLIGALTTPLGMFGYEDSGFLLAWGTFNFVLLFLIPLLSVTLDALKQLRLLRAWLPRSGVELKVAMRRDALAGSGPVEKLWPASSIAGGVDEAVLGVARDLGEELKLRQRGPRLHSALVCVGAALAAAGLSLWSISLDDYGELSTIPMLYFIPALSLAFVPAAWRRRMILEEVVQYLRRSLNWDGETESGKS